MEHRASTALVVGYPHEDVGKFESLPGAVDEAEAIGALLGCTPLTGVAATKAAVLAQLEQASVVHLATHGSMGADGKTRLLLHGRHKHESEVWLGPEDIASEAAEKTQRRLRAQLVVLSACDSGRGQVEAGEGSRKSSHEGVLGLARALMMRGVPTVVAAQWKLPDAETKALMLRFYQLLTMGEEVDVAEALRNAMLHVKGTASSEQQWGGLVVLGAGRVRLSGATVPEEVLLRRLSSLGFTEQQARPVLSACGGDVERAVELIVSSACATETPTPAEGVPPEPEPEHELGTGMASCLPLLEEFLGSCNLSQYAGLLAGRTMEQLLDTTEEELRDGGMKQFHAKRFIRRRQKLLTGLELGTAPEPEPEPKREPEREPEPEPESESEEEAEFWD